MEFPRTIFDILEEPTESVTWKRVKNHYSGGGVEKGEVSGCGKNFRTETLLEGKTRTL